MMINIRRYLAGLLLGIIIFIGTFCGITDAQPHHLKSNELHSKHRKHHYSDNRSYDERFG